MFLRYRPVRLQDLEECQYCLRDHFAYDDKARADLVRFWGELICGGSANAMAIEDASAPPGHRIMWFCIKVFVPEAYAAYLKVDAPPLVGRHILDQWCAGRSPLLDAACVRRANCPRHGLNMLVLNSGSPPDVRAGEKWPIVLDKLIEFTQFCAGGYCLRELLIEVYDDYTASWLQGTGMHLRTEYASFYSRGPAETPAADRRSQLFGVTAEEASCGPGKIVSPLFHCLPPRFGFTPVEQELLLWALAGDADEDLAESMNVAFATVKKRWKSVYCRVQAAMPELLSEATTPTERRGSEKKRRLISYLRHHLEELRPAPSFRA